MIGRLILLIAFVIIAVTIYRMIQNTPKSQQKALYWKIGLSALAIAIMLMVVTGRVHWIGALFAAILPFIRNMLPWAIRLFPMFQQLKRSHQASNAGSATQGNCSTVNTAVLSMVLDHDTNELSGEVIDGPYQGHTLDSLSLDQLNEVLDYCQRIDTDSVKLLVSYLNHRFGSGWQNQQQTASSANGEMTKAEAYELLGLSPGASKDEVIKAHRKLMQKVHPDRGGNDYLAAKINLAKDLLIG